MPLRVSIAVEKYEVNEHRLLRCHSLNVKSLFHTLLYYRYIGKRRFFFMPATAVACNLQLAKS